MIHNREVDLSRLSETQLSELSLFELQCWHRINRGPVPRQYNKNDLISAIRRTPTYATLVPSTASSTDGVLSEYDYSAMTLDQLNSKTANDLRGWCKRHRKASHKSTMSEARLIEIILAPPTVERAPHDDRLRQFIDLDQERLLQQTNEDAFPPTVDSARNQTLNERASEKLQPPEYEKTGVWASCCIHLPSLVEPHLVLSQPIASNSDQRQPYLHKLRMSDSFWEHVPPTVTPELFESTDYHGDPLLVTCVLDREGVQPPDNGSIHCKLTICSGCQPELRQEKCAVPRFPLANDNFTGHLTRKVQQLPVLNFVEEQVIALKRISNCVVKLRNSRGRTSHQLALKGHIMFVKQDPTRILPFADDSVATAWLGAHHFCGHSSRRHNTTG
jgi:hypothetical protein